MKEFIKNFLTRKQKSHGLKEENIRGFSTMVNRIKVNHYNLNESLGRKEIIDMREMRRDNRAEK